MRCFVFVQLVFGQRGKAKQIHRERDQHTNTRGGKAVMPSDFLAQRSTYQRREKCTQIDPDIKNGIGAIAAMIARCVERTHLARRVGLENAHSDDEQEQRRKQQRFKCHHEMTKGHQHNADYHHSPLPHDAIGQPAAQ